MATKQQAYDYASEMDLTILSVANEKGQWNTGRLAIVGFTRRSQIMDCINTLGGQHEIFRYTEDSLSVLSMGLAEDFNIPKEQRYPTDELRFLVDDVLYVPGVAV